MLDINSEVSQLIEDTEASLIFDIFIYFHGFNNTVNLATFISKLKLANVTPAFEK